MILQDALNIHLLALAHQWYTQTATLSVILASSRAIDNVLFIEQ